MKPDTRRRCTADELRMAIAAAYVAEPHIDDMRERNEARADIAHILAEDRGVAEDN